MVRLICVLLLAARGVLAGETIAVHARRALPPGVPAPEGFKTEERIDVPLVTRGCDGKARLQSVGYALSVGIEGQNITVRVDLNAGIEKIAKGPLYPPALMVEMQETSVGVAFETSMASARWEGGGAFSETFTSDQIVEPKFWKGLVFQCFDESPFRAAVIPEDVTYKRAGDDVVAAAAALLDNTLRSEVAFGGVALYAEGMTLIGPDLFANIGSDPALQSTSSPKMMVIDPATGKHRAMLRIQGAGEASKFGEAMRRYLGNAKPRIRALTSAELARHWLNIGWDIEEPLLLADYGARRIVFTFSKGRVMMVDEIP